MDKLLELQLAEGLGNKFIIINDFSKCLEDIQELIPHLVKDFEFDQLIILDQFIDNKLYIRIFNRDGSTSEACGNAFRCLGLMIFQDFQIKNFNIINHLNQPFLCQYIDDQNIAVTFPKPIFDLNEIINFPDLGPIQGLIINVGNPHLLFNVDILDLGFLAKYGEEIISNPQFPGKINLSLLKVLDRDNIQILTYERGAGITQACGSGALAASIYARLKHNCANLITVKMLGGALNTYWEGATTLPKIIGSAKLREKVSYKYNY